MGVHQVSNAADNNQKLIFGKLDAIRDVPTLPAIALRALEISNGDDSSAKELAVFIGRDQALTTRLLALTNSTAYRLAGKVATVDRAVIILGFAKVRSIVLSASTSNIFAGASDCLDRGRLWRHSIATATAARLLAKGIPGSDPETAYIAGLLHEVGIIIMDRYFHEALRAAVQIAHAQRTTIDKALRDLIGLDQFRIGNYLAKRWKLPDALSQAIGLHNNPPLSDVNAQVISLVHVASMIADACKINYEPYAAAKPISANAIQLLGITPVKIKAAADELNNQRASMDEFAELCSR